MKANSAPLGDSRWFPVPKDIFSAGLLEAMEASACPVCSARQRSAQSFFSSLLWEGVNDPSLRHTLRESLGFCSHHTHELGATARQPWAGALGVAIVYRDLVDTVLLRLRDARKRLARRWLPSTPAPTWLRKTRRCPPCEVGDGAARGSMLAMVEGLDTSLRFREFYRQSWGLCLAHTRQAMRMVRTSQAQVCIAGHASTRMDGILLRRAAAISEFEEFVLGSGPQPGPTRAESVLPNGCLGCRAEAAAERSYLGEIMPDGVELLWTTLCPKHREHLVFMLLREQESERARCVLVQCVFSELDGAASTGDCPLCQQAQDAARVALARSMHEVGQTACLQHVWLASQGAFPAQRLDLLASLEARLECLSWQLGELARKHDYRFASEPWGVEGDSWLRALDFFGGDPYTSC